MSVIKIALLTSVLVSGSAMAQNVIYKAADQSPETRLCVSAAVNSKNKFRHDLYKYRTSTSMFKKYKMVANQLQCNGINVVSFAYQAGNDPLADQLNEYRKTSITIREIAKLPEFDGTITGSY